MGRRRYSLPIYGGRSGLCCPPPRHPDWASATGRKAERATQAQVFETSKGFRTTDYAEAVAAAGPAGAGAVHKVFTCQRADCTFTGTYALVLAHEQRFAHEAAADGGSVDAPTGWPEGALQTPLCMGVGSESGGTRTEAGDDGLSGGGDGLSRDDGDDGLRKGGHVVPRVPNAGPDDGGWVEKQGGDSDDGIGKDGVPVLSGAGAPGRAGERPDRRHHHVETYRCSRGCGFVGTVSPGGIKG